MIILITTVINHSFSELFFITSFSLYPLANFPQKMGISFSFWVRFSYLGIDRKKTFVWGFMTKRCSWKLTLQNWQENICAGETPVPGVFLCVQDFAKHFFFRTLLDDYFWQNNFGNQVLYKKILFNLKVGLSPSKKFVLFTSMKTH